MPVEELETPVLVIDLAVMERNLDRMMTTIGRSGARLRPHLKTAKSPAIAHLMLRAGAVGVCAAKLSEAEVLANAGIDDILLTCEVAGFGKFERLVALAGWLPGFKAVVDSQGAVDAIAGIAQRRGVTVKLLIELVVGQGRSGVHEPERVLALAQRIQATECLEFLGIHAYAGEMQHVPLVRRRRENAAAMEPLRVTLDLLEANGVTPQLVSGGGTGTVEFDLEAGLLNEIQAGSFLLMDTDYRKAGVPFENALFCRSTIVSRPAANRAVCDAGAKTLSFDSGPAEVVGYPGITYGTGSDEHGKLTFDPDDPAADLRIGDVVTLLPSHVCTTINLHDVLVGVRDGVVETIWPVEARGHVW
jgi:D-serine deaminase-like pyridoxal phosphate-dependent protein